MIETPKVGCDIVLKNDEGKILLIQRADNGLWALPGGYNDLGESPAECARRECLEETGLNVEITKLLGVFSSLKYRETSNSVNYQREICHILFQAKILSGSVALSDETKAVNWFSKSQLPPLSDGHLERIEFAFDESQEAYFE